MLIGLLVTLEFGPIGCPETSIINYLFYAAYNFERAQIYFTPRRKPEIIYKILLFN